MNHKAGWSAASHFFPFLAVSWLALAAVAMAAERGMPEGVLILHSNQRPLPAGAIIDDTLRKVVSRELGRHAELFSEYLDVEWFAKEAFDKSQVEFLHRKYSARNVRVIVAVAPPALRFMLAHRNQILPGVPVVQLSVPKDLQPKLELPPEFVGATTDLDPAATFELAMRLQPAAKRLVIVVGAANRDQIWERRIRDAAGGLSNRLDVEYLIGLPTAEVLRRLGALSPNTIVYTPGYFADGTGLVVTPRQSVEQMAAASTAPLYGPISTFVGAGVVGGHMSSYEDQAIQAGAVVVRLLNGAAPAAIPASPMQNVPIVDWRQIRRWGIDERLLPANTVVRFREPSVWNEHWRAISIGIAVVLLQLALIIALLFERRGRRRTVAELDASEQRMELAARAANLTTWIWDIASDRIWLAPQSRRRGGLTDDQQLTLESALRVVHPADRERVKSAGRQALSANEDLNIAYRVVRPDGEVRWIAVRGRLEQGGGQRLLGVALDITERKAAELEAERDRTALRHVTRVSALGQLSASIAHELNQPLAAILNNAEAARKMLSREPIDVVELREICNDIVTENHRAVGVITRLRTLFSRGELQFQRLDVNELIRDTLELLHTDLLVRHVTAVTELAPSLPVVEGGRVELQQVLLNLIVNAADAMEKNADGDREFVIRTDVTGADVRIFVADRGPGVAAVDLENIFEPFWSGKPGGMGMGLAICRSIVTTHGGTLTADNDHERGATFCVTLPVRHSA